MKAKEDFDGLVFDIIKVEKNTTLKVEPEYEELLMPTTNIIDSFGKIIRNKRSYIYTLIMIQITNHNNSSYSILSDKFKLVDNEGNQYETANIDWHIKNSIFINGYIDTPCTIMPYGKIKTILVFPRLEKRLVPRSLFYYDYAYINKSLGLALEGYIKIDLNDFSVETNASKQKLKEREAKRIEETNRKKEEFKKYQDELSRRAKLNAERYAEEQRLREERKKAALHYKQIQKLEDDYKKLKNKIDSLETLIYKRFNNILSYKELASIENSIQNAIFEISNMPINNDDLLKKYNSIKKAYYDAISIPTIHMVEFKEKFSLDNMDSKEFEIYVFEKFKEMGYSPKLTSEFLDEGIDIILEKDGDKYGVQCKYYKPNRFVGSEIMLHFLGALTNIHAKGGFLVTTGRVTKSALFIAERNNIQVIVL